MKRTAEQGEHHVSYAPEHNSPVMNERANAGENPTFFYTLWTVFKRSQIVERSEGAANEFDALIAELDTEGAIVRGIYDVSAMREDADIMVWVHGPSAQLLQASLRKIRRSALFEGTEIVYSTMAVHREAEFAKNHSPAFARGIRAKLEVPVSAGVASQGHNLIGKTEYAREVQGSVRIRAECLRPVAAGATPDTTGTLCDTAPGA